MPGDVTTTLSMAFKQKSFNLNCETMDGFLYFYLVCKGISHTLKVVNCVAATDNVFPKAYFESVIQTPELHHKMKKLLNGALDSYVYPGGYLVQLHGSGDRITCEWHHHMFKFYCFITQRNDRSFGYSC